MTVSHTRRVIRDTRVTIEIGRIDDSVHYHQLSVWLLPFTVVVTLKEVHKGKLRVSGRWIRPSCTRLSLVQEYAKAIPLSTVWRAEIARVMEQRKGPSGLHNNE